MFKGTLNTSKMYLGLKKQAEISEKKLHKRHPHVVKFFLDHGISPGGIRLHAARAVTTLAIGGSMLLSQPLMQQALSTNTVQMTPDSLKNQLASLLPKDVQPLTRDQEEEISRYIQATWGIDARGTLEGNHLNTTYGMMGAEQHLMRYPGDNVPNMAPGKGAWGYFAPSSSQMTQDLFEKEEWYVAVQTLYLPDWNTRTRELYTWYKYRKVLVVNVKNGKTVVANIADAGPAKWTGKHFGGSPEIMAYLGLNVHMQKGAVILFFVNDPNGEIPLGPVAYNVKIGRKP